MAFSLQSGEAGIGPSPHEGIGGVFIKLTLQYLEGIPCFSGRVLDTSSLHRHLQSDSHCTEDSLNRILVLALHMHFRRVKEEQKIRESHSLLTLMRTLSIP